MAEDKLIFFVVVAKGCLNLLDALFAWDWDDIIHFFMKFGTSS